jgi:hypothetical protein
MTTPPTKPVISTNPTLGQPEGTAPAEAGAITIDEQVAVPVQPRQTDIAFDPAAGGGDANAGVPGPGPMDHEVDGKGYVPDGQRKDQPGDPGQRV